MKYLIYEYGKPKTAKECKTLHEALSELHKGKPDKVYRIQVEDEGKNGVPLLGKYSLKEAFSVRYKDINGFIITEIL